MNNFYIEPLGIIKFITLGCVGVLLWQTFNIQVLNQDVYKAKTKSMVMDTKNVYADRGRIMDRNGIVFALYTSWFSTWILKVCQRRTPTQPSVINLMIPSGSM